MKEDWTDYVSLIHWAILRGEKEGLPLKTTLAIIVKLFEKAKLTPKE